MSSYPSTQRLDDISVDSADAAQSEQSPELQGNLRLIDALYIRWW